MPNFETEFDKHYSESLALLRSSGSAEAVYKHINAITDDDYRNSTLAKVALFLVAEGNVSQAEHFCASISRPLDRAYALADISHALIKSHQIEAADNVLGQAVEASRTIAHDTDAATVLLQLGDLLKEIGKRDAALKLIQQAVSLAKPVPQNFESAKTLRGCARILGHWNLMEEAVTVAQMIDNQWSDLRETALQELQGKGQWPVNPERQV